MRDYCVIINVREAGSKLCSRNPEFSSRETTVQQGKSCGKRLQALARSVLPVLTSIDHSSKHTIQTLSRQLPRQRLGGAINLDSVLWCTHGGGCGKRANNELCALEEPHTLRDRDFSASTEGERRKKKCVPGGGGERKRRDKGGEEEGGKGEESKRNKKGNKNLKAGGERANRSERNRRFIW